LLTRKHVKEFLKITAGAAIVAVALYFFMMPSGLTIGSVAALAMVISNFIPVPVSVLMFIMNGVLLAVSFVLIGRDFGVKTVYTALITPVFTGILEVAFPNFQSITQEPILDAACYILIAGIGIAILFSCNASSGGLDIIAKLMNKYLRMDIGKAMSVSGLLVAASGVLCYEAKIVVISMLGTYFGGMVVDHFIFGFDLKRRMCIISPKLDEIREFIIKELHSGATINEIIGAYDMTPRREIIVIVNKHEYRALMDYVRKTDPKAFVTVYAVNEVSYVPKG